MAVVDADVAWVAHPALVEEAMTIFNDKMPTPNQLHKQTPHDTKASDLVALCHGDMTLRGLKMNIDICLQYMTAWLAGSGAVPIHHLMEDAATCEISRSQLWMWVRHHCCLQEGMYVTSDLVHEWIDKLKGDKDERAVALLKAITMGKEDVVKVKGCKVQEVKGYPDFVTDVMVKELEGGDAKM